MQAVGELLAGRVVEEDRGGQPQSGAGVELVAQLDGGERVEAELLEGLAGRDGVRAGVPEDARRVGLDVPHQDAALFGGRGAAEFPLECPACLGGLLPLGPLLGGFGEVGEERAGAQCGEADQEPAPVDGGDGGGRVAVVQGVPQGSDGQFGVERVESAAAEEVECAVVGGHADLAPGAPGQ
ncbi:hypothetical protein ACZ90_68810 [Streptomyces albus subsp. albus]|nr:hypothetical protein ACZ90_68810 [Streptomyces albus subsp. albus]